MSDVNRRADAIEAVASADETNGTIKVFSGLEVIDILKALPSAEAEWIPVSERLPSGPVEVIVSIHEDTGDTSFDYTSSGFTTMGGEYWIVDNEINYHVIAWMPLPKPYGGDEE